MLPERRRQYLETIGIDLWVKRTRAASAVAPAAASIRRAPICASLPPICAVAE